MNGEALWVLCGLLFLDGATFAFFTTVLLLHYGQFHPPWQVAVFGGASSALGSMLQLLALRWAMASGRRWMHRFAPSRDKLEAAIRAYPSASFLAIATARATPLPDAPIKLVAAAAGYPLPLYGIAIYLGSLPYYFALALVGSRVRIPLWVLLGALAVVGIGIWIDRWRRRPGR
jgi:uncharacterized membrane protein YdjX (TVP38/TMEM64 family)